MRRVLGADDPDIGASVQQQYDLDDAPDVDSKAPGNPFMFLVSIIIPVVIVAVVVAVVAVHALVRLARFAWLIS